MLGKPLPYILNLRNIESDDVELVGKDAFENSHLHKLGLKTPSAFVLTTRAFDDFLTASNLIDPITQILEKVKPYDTTSSKEGSEKITKLILESKFPTILERPLVEAYKNLGSHGAPYVSIQISNIISQEYIPISNSLKEINIRGHDEVFIKIKKAWASMFSKEALEKRVNQNYTGPLSVALIIQKMIRAEVSGRLYTIIPTTRETLSLEIHALFGFEDPNTYVDVGADIYKVDKKSKKIIEKVIIEQKYMLVQKGKINPGENANLKVEISNQWKRTQKIDDNKIINLALISENLEKFYKTPIEISWCLELG